MFKNFKGSPLSVSGIVTFFKRNNFRVKIRFSQVRHAISDFCCFERPVFFLCDFLKICFTEAPPQCLPETKRFARVNDYATFRRPSKIFSKFFFLNFLFFKDFSLRKMGFLLFSVGEEWFPMFMRILSGIFLALYIVKLMKF